MVYLHGPPPAEADQTASEAATAGSAAGAAGADVGAAGAGHLASVSSDQVDFERQDAAGESVVIAAALSAGDTTLAVQAQRAERWAHGERGEGGEGGKAGGGHGNCARACSAPTRRSP